MIRIKTGRVACNRVFQLLLMGILCLWQSAVLASAIATVDRTSITEFDLLRLRLRTSDQQVDLTPDFSGIERDFQIVNTQTSQSSSFSITNGRTTSVVYKDYILSLKPKRLGTLSIPPIMVGGTVTAPISIRVAKQSAASRQQMNQLVFFESQVNTEVAYVQGQIIYRLKLFYTEGSTGQFPLPLVLDDAIIEVIENEKRYQSVVNGRAFYVIERRTAIFPQRSGTLVIPRQTFVGTFSTGGFRSQSQRINAVSEAHTITVKRAPSSFSGLDWIPAKSLLVSESWSEEPPTFRVGEPTNRVLRLSALGVSDSLLPALSDLSVARAKVYSDPPATEKQIGADGIMAVQVTNTSILPTQVGELNLPEIRIPWWNITTDKEEIAILPAATYQILPAADIGVPAPRVTVPGGASNQSISAQTSVSPVWQYIAMTLAILWLVSAWQWFSLGRQIRLLRSAETSRDLAAVDDPDEASHYRAFVRACRGHQAAAAHRQLLLWAKTNYPQLHSLAELQQLASVPLADEIKKLEALLYGAGDQPGWQGNRLAELVAELRRPDEVMQQKGSLAASLNPV